MTEASSASPERKSTCRPIGGELVVPGVAIIFTLYYFSTIVDSPWTAQVSAVLIGTVLIVLSALLIGKLALSVRRGKANFKMSQLYSAADISTGRVYLFFVTLAYIILIDWGGFTITTFFFLFLSMLVLNQGRNKKGAAMLSGAMALGGYILFILAFDTRFPRGPFETMMEALLGYGS